MAEIDVEPVDEIGVDAGAVPEGVDAPAYVLYGGKGGVGKTTMAAATALASANDRTATLVASTDPAHSLSDTLETAIPASPERIREDVPLWGVEIDPDAGRTPFEEGVEEMGGLFGGLGGMAGAPTPGGPSEGEAADGDVPAPFDPSAMPGADEAAAFQLLLEYLDDERFERVIVDTAPTGHTLRLLGLPEVMESMVGRLMTFRERIQGTLGDMPGPFGDADAAEGIDRLESLADRIERLRGALRDPATTDFRVVMTPQRMAVVESERLLRRLEEFGVPARTVVVNRVTEDLAGVADVDPNPDWFVSPDPEHCAFCAKRWEHQQDALHRAADVFGSREIKRVPEFAAEVRGEDMLRVVAACLE